MNERDVISDEYISEIGDIILRTYIWGNSEYKNVKPRMQVRIYKNDEIVFDKNYNEMPPTKDDISEIERNILKAGNFYFRNNILVTMKGRKEIDYDLKKWENTLKKYIPKSISGQFNTKDLYQEMLCDSEQVNSYLARKYVNDLWK